MNKYIHEIINSDEFYFLENVLYSDILSLEEVVDIVIKDACEDDIYKLILFIKKKYKCSIDKSTEEYHKKIYSNLTHALMNINTDLAQKYLIKLITSDFGVRKEIINFIIQNGDFYSLTNLYLALYSVQNSTPMLVKGQIVSKPCKLEYNDYLETVKNIWLKIFLNQNDYAKICQFLISQNIYTQKIFKTILDISNRTFIEYFKNYLEHTQEFSGIKGLINTLNDIFLQNELANYSNDELFAYLINLCKNSDIVALKKNKEIFRAMFTQTENKELHK